MKDKYKKQQKPSNMQRTGKYKESHMQSLMDSRQNTIRMETEEEKNERYEKEAKANWGEERVGKSIKLWNSYSKEEQKRIMDEGDEIYKQIAMQMSLDPGHPEIQMWIEKWHEYMYHFYEPSLELLRGLGDIYDNHPEFNEFLAKFHPGLPSYLNTAIGIYVDTLEERWLQQEYCILQE